MKVTVITRTQTEIVLPEGANVSELLAAAGLTNEAGITSIEGRAVRREHILRDGDAVRVFPEIIGG